MADNLQLLSVIGFNGQVPDGLLVHPHGHTLVYSLGSQVVLRDRDRAASQEFLQGHTDTVSSLALSKSGRYLASGQATHLGFVADIIIWDLASRSLMHRLQLQKGKIQALAFSPDECHLASLGGPDDNSLVVWDVTSGQPVCGAPTGNGFSLAMAYCHSNDRIVTGGNSSLTLWTFDAALRKLTPHPAQLGALQRQVRSLAVEASDAFVYAGTSSGDVLQVSLDRMMLRNTGPGKHPLAQGAVATALLPGGAHLVAGGGDGTLCVLRTTPEPSATNLKVPKKMPVTASIRLEGAVTSIALTPAPPAPPTAGTTERSAAALRASGRSGGSGGGAAGAAAAGGASAACPQFSAYVGTAACNVYLVTSTGDGKLTHELMQTAHPSAVRALAFPAGTGEVFATAGRGGIRLWGLASGRELLRISVPGLECQCLAFTPDGKGVLSGWCDGKVRAFGPETGRLLYTIHDAHHAGGVTALAPTNDSARLVTGGGEGMVRLWRLGRGGSHSMEASLKDHRGPVNAITLTASSAEAASASSDGSVILWSLRGEGGSGPRKRASLFASSFFTAAAFHPDESQLLTGGTDHKLTWWDASDGTAIRIVDGSPTSEVNAVAVDPDGVAIVTGGGDKLVKLWGYDEALCYATGVAHSSAVTGVAIAPDKSCIVSVGADGAICIWRYAPPVAAAGGE